MDRIEQEFVRAFEALSARAHHTTVLKGFYEKRPGEPWDTLSAICLMHSELSEAAEAVRRGDPAALTEELADVVIRLMDTGAYLRLDVGAAVVKKMRLNTTRPAKHGKLA